MASVGVLGAGLRDGDGDGDGFATGGGLISSCTVKRSGEIYLRIFFFYLMTVLRLAEMHALLRRGYAQKRVLHRAVCRR